MPGASSGAAVRASDLPLAMKDHGSIFNATQTKARSSSMLVTLSSCVWLVLLFVVSSMPQAVVVLGKALTGVLMHLTDTQHQLPPLVRLDHRRYITLVDEAHLLWADRIAGLAAIVLTCILWGSQGIEGAASLCFFGAVALSLYTTIETLSFTPHNYALLHTLWHVIAAVITGLGLIMCSKVGFPAPPVPTPPPRLNMM